MDHFVLQATDMYDKTPLTYAAASQYTEKSFCFDGIEEIKLDTLTILGRI